MKPQILFTTAPEGTNHGFLVDQHSAIVRMEDGKERTHYLTAIDLRACKAGQVELMEPDENGVMQIIAPAPCVLAVRKKMKDASIEARGLDHRAAVVMLRLAASAQNVQVPFNGSMTWTFGEPVQRTDDPSIMAGATIQKLIAAWHWSAWQAKRKTGAQRLADMQRLGYRGTAGALRDMMSDLGLVATRSK